MGGGFSAVSTWFGRGVCGEGAVRIFGICQCWKHCFRVIGVEGWSV